MDRTSTATPAALYARAHRLHGQQRLEEALQVLDLMLARWPDHVDARNLAGVICMMRRDFRAAVTHLRQAAARPGGVGVGALANLGFAYQALERFDQAADAYEEALRREPKLGFAWQKLGGLRDLQGRSDEALDCYRRAVDLDPGDLKSLGEALSLRRNLADWAPEPGPTPEDLVAGFRREARSDYSPGLLLSLPEADAGLQRDAAALFARSQWQAALAAPPLVPGATDATGRPLRIGYLSSDFRNHAVSFLALETIAAHDRDRVRVFLYAHGPPVDDPWRHAAIAAADHFADIDALDDAQAARRIAADRIDVLVDLNGYTKHGRPGILAHRPAATIAGWIGYIGTMGEPRLGDYVIGDAIATPPWMAPCFSEALALLPRCYQPNGKLRTPPPLPARKSEGLPEEAFVFCSFNQTHKLHPSLWDDWCAILAGVPDSVLWLVPPGDPSGERNLRLEAGRRGVDPDRILFAEKKSRDGHLARLALADLALDTWPYNSGTTASDALRAGVPLVTFLGETFAGRMAGSLLHAAGLPECVADDRFDYVRLATALGRDPARLADLRRRVGERLPDSTLFRPDAQARDLERLFAAMHANRLEGKRDAIALDTDLAAAQHSPGGQPPRW